MTQSMLTNSPTADAEDGADTVQFDLCFALANQEADVEQHRRRVDVEEHFGEIFGQLVVAFELITDRVQQRTGRPHVTDRSPRATPTIQYK